MKKRKIADGKDPLPEQFSSVSEAAEFWDSHDLADYWQFTEEQGFEVSLDRSRHLVGLSPDLAKSIVAEARRRGLSSETLVNLWLAEKLRSMVT
jgi:CopG antitoxin of type II toxin-antitoxin system